MMATLLQGDEFTKYYRPENIKWTFGICIVNLSVANPKVIENVVQKKFSTNSTINKIHYYDDKVLWCIHSMH